MQGREYAVCTAPHRSNVVRRRIPVVVGVSGSTESESRILRGRFGERGRRRRRFCTSCRRTKIPLFFFVSGIFGVRTSDFYFFARCCSCDPSRPQTVCRGTRTSVEKTYILHMSSIYTCLSRYTKGVSQNRTRNGNSQIQRLHERIYAVVLKNTDASSFLCFS